MPLATQEDVKRVITSFVCFHFTKEQAAQIKDRVDSLTKLEPCPCGNCQATAGLPNAN